MTSPANPDTLSMLTDIFAPAADAFVIINSRGIIKMVNPSVREIFGYSDEEMLGQNVSMLMPSRYAVDHDGHLDRYMKTGVTNVIGSGRQVEARAKDGAEFPIDLSVSEIQLGEEKHFVGIIRDISDKIEAERIIEEQRKTLLKLSTPAIQLWDDIVLMPLVGEIDSVRAANLIERLLECIAEHQAEVAILDLTGVPVIDTDVSHHLMKTVAAAKMLGAAVILTGIKPSGAQTLVQLGVNLANINTKGSLRSGVAEAMRLTNRKLVSLSSD
ncbi:PAS domain S-box protein [Magnetofaba australis]|nr:PAS domain S-box protein [Magnetofaba australis]